MLNISPSGKQLIEQKMLLQDSTRESSPFLKPAGSAHVCCKVLQLWQAGKMVLMEVQAVSEGLGQCLARMVRGRVATMVELQQTPKPELHIVLNLKSSPWWGSKQKLEKPCLWEQGSMLQQTIANIQLFFSVHGAGVFCYQSSQRGAESLSYSDHLGISLLACQGLAWASMWATQ